MSTNIEIRDTVMITNHNRLHHRRKGVVTAKSDSYVVVEFQDGTTMTYDVSDIQKVTVNHENPS